MRFFLSTFTLVLALALTGCADEFATDGAASAKASQTLTVTATSPGISVDLDWGPCFSRATSTVVTRTFIGPIPPGSLGPVTVFKGCKGRDSFLDLEPSGPYRVIYSVDRYGPQGLIESGSSDLLFVTEAN